MSTLTIYTDGSCLKNPGGAGGYGAVLLTTPPTLISGHIPAPTTNNRAEIMAVLYAIYHAQALGYKNLKVYSDSQYVVNTLNSFFNRSKNRDLWDLIDLAKSTLDKVTFHWIRGHNGQEYNELADKLASDGAHKYTEIPLEIKDETLSTTQVGERLVPKMKAIELNKLLLQEGYQTKTKKGYAPTDKGEPYAVLDIYADAYGGTYITKFHWTPSFVKVAQDLLDKKLNCSA